jgi:hypothetical protein
MAMNEVNQILMLMGETRIMKKGRCRVEEMKTPTPMMKLAVQQCTTKVRPKRTVGLLKRNYCTILYQ